MFMKNVIEGLIKNSKSVKVYSASGVIFVEDNEQLKEVFDCYDTVCIDFSVIPLKATVSYEAFIAWWIPHLINLEKLLYKPMEEC